MTKMKKNEFKALVKECVRECIREIISEQIDPAPIKEALRSRNVTPVMVQNQLQKQASTNSLMTANVDADIQESGRSRYNTTQNTGYTNPSDRLRLAASAPDKRGFNPMLDVPRQQSSTRAIAAQTVSTPDIVVPGPDILNSILDDTARTTLLEQTAAESRPQVANKYAAIVAENNPDDLFQGSQNWAALAFKNS